MRASHEPVWITGLGACSALGADATALAEALEQGRSGVRLQAGAPAQGVPPFVAAAVTAPLGQGLGAAQRALCDRHSLMAWQALGVMAPPDPEDPAESCRPFDDRRRGLVLGEGAAALVLETARHARQRGAQPLAELAGYGHSVDAVHLSRPEVEGQVRAMTAALADARLVPAQVAYVNAHGTATDTGDAVEAASLTRVFGVRGVAVSATKALHGHLIGASGALELVATVQALRRGRAPASAHVRDAVLRQQLDLVPEGGRPLRAGP